MDTGAVRISIPPRPQFVAVVRLALVSLARELGVGEESIDEIKIAISEALTNAVMTQAEADPKGSVTVEWQGTEQAMEVSISIPAEQEEQESEVDTLGFSTRAALSEALLQTLVDDYSIDQSAGLTVRLRFNLAKRRSEEIVL